MICLNCGRTRERVVGCACIPEGFWQRPDVARARDSGDATRVIRLLRAYTDLSQEAIARLTGLSQGMVSQIESGRRSLRDPVRKRRALEGLGVSERLPEDPAAAPAAAARPATVHSSFRGDSRENAEVRWLLSYAAQVTMGVHEVLPEKQTQEWTVSTPIPGQVTAVDVEHLEALTEALRAADYKYGGGACRDAVGAHLRRAQQLLHSERIDGIDRRLRLALADLHNLAGWTDFDIGLVSQARQHFAHALQHAKQVDAPSLSANVLYRTGRLHLHRGLHGEALKFFQLGQIEAQNANCELTVSLLCANEAWAYALIDDEARSLQSLQRAQDEFARADRGSAPAWVRFFSEADLHAMIGVASAAVPTPSKGAYSRATASLEHGLMMRGDDMSRSQAFELTALATTHIVNGDIDHGVTVGTRAVELAEQLRSRRVIDRLEPLKHAALRSSAHGDARDLAGRIATLRPA